MAEPQAPKKAHRMHHRRLVVEHANGAPDRDVTRLSKMSDDQLAERINMHALAKPIPSDATHIARQPHTHPIPIQPAPAPFPSHPDNFKT
jgi:hypothetical protein